MPTTFANTIDGNDIYAKRAECDAAGNDLSTTYATKSELPDGVPAVTSSDNNKVLKASYSGGVASYSWQTESGGGGGTVTDVEVDGTSVVSGGVASITMPTELVPTVTSSDNNKVLKASYSGGVGSYSWQTESGGGGGGGDGADWAAEEGEPGYIENKPVPKTLTGGTGISITESPSTITVSCNVTAPVQDVTVDGTSVVSNGVAAITSPTVDQTYDASSSNAQSGVAVAEGISDAIGDLPTNLTSAQIQSFKEALGCDETVLWEGTLSPSFGPNCNVTFQVSESILNFERIEVFCNGSISYLTWHPVSGKTGTPVAYQGLNENTSNDVVIGGVIIVDNNTTLRYRCGYGSSFTTSYRGEYWGYGTPYKVVGVHRIASN